MTTTIRSLLLVAPLLALAACDSGVSSLPGTAIEPANVTRAVAQLDDVAEGLFARSGIPGMAVAVVHRGEIVYARGYGVRRLGDDAAIEPETVFQLASLSKSVGATVVAAQVGKGHVSWDTRIRPLLPSFRLADPADTDEVTVGDLYAHRSGLPDHAGDDLEEMGYSREEVFKRLHRLPARPLRTHYAYTNFGLTAAAQAVANAAGNDWESLSEQALYQPLDMRATSSRYADFMARGNRAQAHVRVDGAWQPGPQRQPDAQSPAGGVSSNVLDMAKWMNLVLEEGRYQGQTLIPREALGPALTPQIQSSPATSEHDAGHYGYGFNLSDPAARHKQISHSGAFIMGAGTSFNLLPDADTGIVVLTNAAPVGVAEALCASYLDLVKYGEITRDWLAYAEGYFAQMTAPSGSLVGEPFPATPVPPLSTHAYTGAYTNPYHGEVNVVESDGSLALLLGPAARAFPLRHWNGNVFVFEPSGEMASAGSRSVAEFAPGPGGVMTSLRVEILDEHGLGSFQRH